MYFVYGRCAVTFIHEVLNYAVENQAPYRFGLTPVIFLKTREKYAGFEKPDFAAVSVTLKRFP